MKHKLTKQQILRRNETETKSQSIKFKLFHLYDDYDNHHRKGSDDNDGKEK